MGRCPRVDVGMRVSDATNRAMFRIPTDSPRIVEYATREQAQQAVQTLSNQNLMGRLVYVREVSSAIHHACPRLAGA